MLMIWSSRERNRSCSPLSRRSRGRIEIPPLESTKPRESQLQIRGNPKREFARKSVSRPQIPANPIAAIPAISIARQSLRDISRTTDLTVKDIAESLGFSEAANFRQAFRRWTKAAPYEFKHLSRA
jgi:methylphosphotriester-DNA--protein-cysteine methyltransferase